MKETGLMFKAPLVRAILNGQKTATRRLFTAKNGGVWPNPNDKPGMAQILRSCKYGRIGDLIYVRETFARVPTACGSDELVYAADYQDGSDKAAGVKYTPCLLMSKSAARIWLEVTGVRVERLNSISEQDAISEGCETVCMTPTGDDNGSAIYGSGGFAELWDSTTGRPVLPKNPNSTRYARVKQCLDTHPDTTSWAANPWVWVIDFKRIEKP
ncbi:MAG: ASCH domain-containing protein [Comamonas sp.]|uniref:ASCH domain-containing protein n=1 Tax=Comamonas sp. TaxID=34028 RepID=UPI002FC85546